MWGPQGPPPPSGGGGNKAPLIIVLVVVAIAAIGGAAFFLLSGDSDSGGDSPEGTIRTLGTATEKGDCETATELTTANYWSFRWGTSDREGAVSACEDEFQFLQAGTLKVTIDSIEEQSADEQTAVLVVQNTQEFTMPGAEPEVVTETDTYHLVNDDGTWKVDSVGGSGGLDSDDDSDFDTDTGFDDSDFDTDTGFDDSDFGDDTGFDNDFDTGDSDFGSGDSVSGLPGSPPPSSSGDSQLDQWADECFQGDMGSCGDLYVNTPVGSAHEEYGATCGGRRPTPPGTGGTIPPCT